MGNSDKIVGEIEEYLVGIYHPLKQATDEETTDFLQIDQASPEHA
jgi:hypothetical protein